MAAKMLEAPEWEITEDEAAKLGKAVARVNAVYGGLVVSPKVSAWINLATVAGAIYGPRLMIPKKEERPQTIDAVM